MAFTSNTAFRAPPDLAPGYRWLIGLQFREVMTSIDCLSSGFRIAHALPYRPPIGAEWPLLPCRELPRLIRQNRYHVGCPLLRSSIDDSINVPPTALGIHHVYSSKHVSAATWLAQLEEGILLPSH